MRVKVQREKLRWDERGSEYASTVSEKKGKVRSLSLGRGGQ